MILKDWDSIQHDFLKKKKQNYDMGSSNVHLDVSERDFQNFKLK